MADLCDISAHQAKIEEEKNLASYTDEEAEQHAQEVGAIGCAIVVAAGLTGEDVKDVSRRLVKVSQTYYPDPGNKAVYERNYKVFKNLYRSNAENFRRLNG